ncbi:DUF5691 domain-containing protein [Spongiactinospora sp. 9N601]|uniref:DUF5691 domain-containing protein n=1 Tax=Spongiactinospora sp. 9N601 TaxID=3375149 RepID=UPI0037AEBA46
MPERSGAQWQQIVSAALVGTDRRPPYDPAGGGDPAVDLLERAAVETVRRRAGQRLSRGEPLPPAPAEDRPAVSRAAADRLARILGGEHSRLLPEWLAEAARQGLRVPPHLLPELLDHAAKDRSIRPHVAALAARRGRWLATLHDAAWPFLAKELTTPPAHPAAPGLPGVPGAGTPGQAGLVGPDTPGAPGSGEAAGRRPGDSDVAGGGVEADGGEVWRLGTQGDRVAYLAGLRAVDPGAAPALLSRGWEREGPDDRAAFLGVLEEGLSAGDEPFLEGALDDRRREVRQAAADLLTRLPGSRLGERMAERGRRCLRPSGGRIAVVPPETCDAGMARDGVRAAPPRGTGERSWWLQQVVARTPLRVWAEVFGVPPDILVGMKIIDWGREVRAGWVRAAVLQRDPAWARALFAVDPLAELLAVLRPAEQEALAADFVARHPVDGQLIMVLGGAAAPWGPALTRAVLHKILDVAGTQPWNLGELIRLAGERADPAQHQAAAGLSLEPPVQEVAAVLRYRSDMLKELS